MFTGASFQHSENALAGRPALRGTLALTFLLVSVTGYAAPQATSNGGLARPKPVSSSKNTSPFREAETLLQQGSVDEAKKKIQEQLARNPSVEGYNLLGIVYSSEKDYAKALEAFQHALKIDPNSTKTCNNLGNLYVAQGRLDLAEKEFRKVLHLDPANSDGNYNLGLILMARNLPAEAIVSFQRVHPSNVATRFNLIRACLLAGRTAEGLKLAKDLSLESKDNVQLHFTLGVLLASAK